MGQTEYGSPTADRVFCGLPSATLFFLILQSQGCVQKMIFHFFSVHTEWTACEIRGDIY